MISEAARSERSPIEKAARDFARAFSIAERRHQNAHQHNRRDHVDAAIAVKQEVIEEFCRSFVMTKTPDFDAAIGRGVSRSLEEDKR